MYFVYDLIDPRDESVFYVGKGKGNRPAAHLAEAAKGVRSRKCDRIREILAAELGVRVKIVERFLMEAEAYQAEAARIESIGLANLTNVVAGGPGRKPSKRKPGLTKGLVALQVKLLARTFRQYETVNMRLTIGGASASLHEYLTKTMNDLIAAYGWEWAVETFQKAGVNLVASNIQTAESC